MRESDGVEQLATELEQPRLFHHLLPCTLDLSNSYCPLERRLDEVDDRPCALSLDACLVSDEKMHKEKLVALHRLLQPPPG